MPQCLALEGRSMTGKALKTLLLALVAAIFGALLR